MNLDLSKLGTPQDVPRFQRADFDGTAPYDYIYKFAANAFQMMQVYNIIAARRTPQGVRGLKFSANHRKGDRQHRRTPQGVRGLKSTPRGSMTGTRVAPRKGCVD